MIASTEGRNNMKTFLEFLGEDFNSDNMKRHPLDAESGPDEFDVASVHDHIEDHGGIPLTQQNIEKHGISYDENLADDRTETYISVEPGTFTGAATQVHEFSTPSGEVVHGLFPQPRIGGQAYDQHPHFPGKRVYESGINSVIAKHKIPEERIF